MENKIYLNGRFSFREDTLENWRVNNPILERGEPSIVRDGRDGEWLKIGDGVTPWNELPYKRGPKGDKGATGEKGKDVAVDQNYTPISENPQSGKAVAEAINDMTRLRAWDGSIADSFSGGEGTESNPYLISTPEQLALMLESFGGGCYYLLTCDLYLNDIYRSAWVNEWFCSESADKTIYTYLNRAGDAGTFSGYIDGSGYTVFGLYHSGYFEGAEINLTALIPAMSDGYIKNLKIDNAYLCANRDVGGFIGITYPYSEREIKIENCEVGEHVCLRVILSNCAAAGFIGYATTKNVTTIKNSCCLTTDIMGLDNNTTYKHNGFIGETWNSSYRLINCYSLLQPINTRNEAARLSVLPFAESYQNVYSATERDYQNNEMSNGTYAFTKVSPDAITGSQALENMPELKDSFINTNSYPAVKAVLRENTIYMLSEVNGRLDKMIPAITNMDLSVVTHSQAGELYVEPNTIYFLSGTENDSCSHDAPTGNVYAKKYIAVIVGQLINGVARCYAIEFSGGLNFSYGNWALDAINGAYTMKLTWSAGATVITMKNKAVEL